MGSTQSIHTTSEIKDLPHGEAPASSANGRKQLQAEDIVLVEPDVISTDEEDSTVGSSDDGGYDSDDEEDEEWNERLRILEDARNLRKVAEFFLHPENPVVADPTACARCFCTRFSAPDQSSPEEEEEAARIFEDIEALKSTAIDFLHPENPVKTDPSSFARNYFSRMSADETEDFEGAEMRAQILADAQALKKLAVDYMQPERPVVTSDPCAMGRNYFTRASAEEAMDGRDDILEDMKQLKKLAIDYLHPERPVVATDACATGRNYFTRASAEAYEGEEEMDDRDDILADLKQLKRLAADYLQPERAVEVDPLASCRNYFTRASAQEYDAEGEDERAQILADAQILKRLAVDYMQPERPVVTSDPCAMGRNYFSRPSVEVFNAEEDEERAQILAEVHAMKRLAIDYLHPERPVVTTDACATGRNYFTRASAEAYEGDDEMDDRDDILADLKQLKRLAVDYLQPERAVEVDPLASCRNYFTRPSAQEYDAEGEDERAQILADAQILKRLAVDYMQPERPVVTSDPCTMGRNYFSRPSAEVFNAEEDEERAQILAEVHAMKRLAIDYLHPERPVVTTDACATGRNYFTRASAQEYDPEGEDERDQILADVQALKKLAVDYMHPEKPVVTSDPCAMGRNYFTRANAEEAMDGRDDILEDMKQLKKLAVDYLHPERPVVATDACATGRNYFTRASAEAYEGEEEMDDRDDILADLKQLKRLAVDYLQPERAVEVDPLASCRNYFTRASVQEYDPEGEDERDQILADAQALKRLAVDYMQPEKPVVTSDPCTMGRNYFTRASVEDVVEEHDDILEDMKQLKKLAVDYLHPERPVITADACATGRNYFTRASAEAYEGEEEMDDRDDILADLKQLKRLAVDYLQPENTVVTSDPCATGRCYFSRPSAPDVLDWEDAKEKAIVLDEMVRLKELAVDYQHPEKPVKTSDGTTMARNYFSRASAPGHGDHIHSQGHAIHQNYREPHLADHGFYQYHEGYHHDDHHDDHHSQSDHFEMDEDMFHEFRESLASTEPFKGEHPEEAEEGDEGKISRPLSRSPSTVMLFEEVM